MVIRLGPFCRRNNKVKRASSLLTNFIFILSCSLYTHVISACVLNKNTLWSTFCSDGYKYNRITFYYYRYNPFEKICLQWRLRKDTISLHTMQWCLGRSLNCIYNKLRCTYVYIKVNWWHRMTIMLGILYSIIFSYIL